jgi:hypothetical protein
MDLSKIQPQNHLGVSSMASVKRETKFGSYLMYKKFVKLRKMR